MLENAPPSPGEVRALASQLLAWADQLATRNWTGFDPEAEVGDELMLALAVSGREISRRRNQIFAHAALGNPAWDVLLELYVQEARGYRVSLDHLALSGELRAETVYASAEVLIEAGMVERTPDRFDARVAWLSLSPSGKRGISEFLRETSRFVTPRVSGDGEPVPC